MNDLPEITEVQRLRLEPGDALVIRLDREPSMQDAHDAQGRVRAVLGRGDIPVLVLGPSATVEVVASFDSREFVTWLKKAIRLGGGDPGILGRH